MPNNNNDDINNKVFELLNSDKNIKTFKIDTKRAWKEFPIHSMDFNRVVASFILKNTKGLTSNLISKIKFAS